MYADEACTRSIMTGVFPTKEGQYPARSQNHDCGSIYVAPIFFASALSAREKPCQSEGICPTQVIGLDLGLKQSGSGEPNGGCLSNTMCVTADVTFASSALSAAMYPGTFV